MRQISKAYLYKTHRKSNKGTQSFELMSFIVFAFVLVASIILISLLGQLQTYAQEIPTEEDIRFALADKGENSKIYDRNGKLLYTFKDPYRDREYITYEEISPEVIAAFLAAEDEDFFVHEGIDYVGSVNGLVTTLSSSGENVIGGSTITQQLVKQVLLSNERTFDRKAKEAIIAMSLEQDYSKEQILEYYLNAASFGGRVQGIRTAARTYFDKEVSELNLNEAAYLAGLVQSPSKYSPLFANNPELAKESGHARKAYVLDQIAENPRLLNYLNTGDKANLRLEPSPDQEVLEGFGKYSAENVLALKDEEHQFNEAVDILNAPHWVFYIRDLVQQPPYNLSLEELYSGGFDIYTSLDLGIQKVVEEKLAEGVGQYGGRYGFENGAALTVDARNGEILAMVGSKGYYLENDGNNQRFDPQVNVVLSTQQLGSSLKPWVAYLALAEGGYSTRTTVQDTPQTFYGYYRPKNADGRFLGAMSLEKALQDSRNLPFLKISYQLGAWRLGEFMEELGYNENEYGLSAAIGGVNENLLDHTIAYTGLANGGDVMRSRPILRIGNADGSDYYQTEIKVHKGLQEGAVGQVNRMLGDKGNRSNNRNLIFVGNRKLAGKTGTTDGNKDTYFIGYGPKIVTGVWIGNNNNDRMRANAFGSSTALPIWNNITGG
ncbi:MAG: transglycosylase domain-containing protein, partial [Candidatus Dojkabacteria bacterium]